MNGIDVTNDFLIEFKAFPPLEKTHNSYCKSLQGLVARTYNDSRTELSTFILLNGHSIKMSAKYISLYL